MVRPGAGLDCDALKLIVCKAIGDAGEYVKIAAGPPVPTEIACDVTADLRPTSSVT
jgi:hypothetical protein